MLMRNLMLWRKKRLEEKSAKHIPLHKYTWGGRVASLMALVNIALFCLTVKLSCVRNGNAGIYVGIIVFCILVSAIIAFVIGVNSFTETDKFFKFSYLGTIANAVLWLGILLIYLTYI